MSSHKGMSISEKPKSCLNENVLNTGNYLCIILFYLKIFSGTCKPLISRESFFLFRYFSVYELKIPSQN